MVELSYLEFFLLFLVAIGFVAFFFLNKKVVYIRDRNFSADLRREIFDSITEDERQEIYQKEYEDIFNMIKKDLFESGVTVNNEFPEQSSKGSNDGLQNVPDNKSHKDRSGTNVAVDFDDQLKKL